MPADREAPVDLASLWLVGGIAAVLGVGVAVFRIVFLSAALGLVLAAALGAAAYYCFDRAYGLFRANAKRPPPRRPLTGRAREIGLAPSFEIYDGRRAGPTPNDRFGPDR